MFELLRLRLCCSRRFLKVQYWKLAALLLLINFAFFMYKVNFTESSQRYRPLGSATAVKRRQGPATSHGFKGIKVKHDQVLTKHSGYHLAKKVQENCRDVNSNFEHETSFWLSRLHVITNHRSIYCPLEKVGSTFWRRFIYQVSHSEEKRNPYEVSIGQALMQHIDSLSNTTTPYDVRDYFKFTFVRNPYNRILSAYIDKLYSPNPMFWHRFGESAITLFREPSRVDISRKRCFSDPTFTEFLQFVTWSIKNRRKMDFHTLIESEMCIMCSLNYTFIGKMENFPADSTEVFRRFGLEKTILSSNIPLSKQAALDAIDDSITSPFNWKDKISKCIGWFEGLLRIWRKLQLRGLIEMKHRLPLKRSSANHISRDYFLQLAYIAHSSSNHTVLKEQKRQVLMEMFRQVPMEILYELRDVYKVDFKLLDYDDTPGYIFDRSMKFVAQNVTDFRN